MPRLVAKAWLIGLAHLVAAARLMQSPEYSIGGQRLRRTYLKELYKRQLPHRTREGKQILTSNPICPNNPVSTNVYPEGDCGWHYCDPRIAQLRLTYLRLAQLRKPHPAAPLPPEEVLMEAEELKERNSFASVGSTAGPARGLSNSMMDAVMLQPREASRESVGRLSSGVNGKVEWEGRGSRSATETCLPSGQRYQCQLKGGPQSSAISCLPTLREVLRELNDKCWLPNILSPPDALPVYDLPRTSPQRLLPRASRRIRTITGRRFLTMQSTFTGSMTGHTTPPPTHRGSSYSTQLQQPFRQHPGSLVSASPAGAGAAVAFGTSTPNGICLAGSNSPRAGARRVNLASEAVKPEASVAARLGTTETAMDAATLGLHRRAEDLLLGKKDVASCGQPRSTELEESVKFASNTPQLKSKLSWRRRTSRSESPVMLEKRKEIFASQGISCDLDDITADENKVRL